MHFLRNQGFDKMTQNLTDTYLPGVRHGKHYLDAMETVLSLV